MSDTIFQPLAISVPIFAMMAFGIVLRRTGMLTDAAQTFITRFVFLFSLPVLIFMAIAPRDFRELFDLKVVGATLGVTLVVAVVSWLLTAKLPGRVRGPAATGAWFANLTFLGLPLAQGAYGDEGTKNVGIINAFTMPVFLLIGLLMLSLGRAQRQALAEQARGAVLNPIVFAVVGGVIASLLITSLDLPAAFPPGSAQAGVLAIVLRTLGYVGQLGVPLALIAIGGALRFDAVRGRLGLMLACTAGKLIVTPLLTWLVCTQLLAPMDPAALGTAVLLMGSPLSVALYVISREMDTDSEFLAGLLVMTTLGACVTIPVWLAILA